jgi:GPH family glycoside/pentoside/hexuronide:cation symporter
MQLSPIKAYVYPGYGIVSVGKVAVEVTLQLYLFDFYTRILGLSPILAGLAFAVAILWDALSDVIVSLGLIAARQRGVSYSTVMWVGSLLLACTTVLLFAPSAEGSQSGLFLHLLLAYVLVNTGMTLMDLPQSSLSSELSTSANERNKLLASRMGFGIAGLAIGSALPGILLGRSGDFIGMDALRGSRELSSWWLAALVLIGASMTCLMIRRRERATQHTAPAVLPRWRELRCLFEDRGFMCILCAGIIAAVARTVNAALALIYYRLVLQLSETQVTQAILPVFTLCIVISIPLWIWLSKRFGKQRPAAAAVSLLGAIGCVAYPLLPAHYMSPTLLVSVITGLLCGAVFLVESMITDFIDANAIETAQRKEALYFAVWKSGLKVARAIAFVCVGVGLHMMGVDLAAEAISTQMQVGIVLLFGIFVGACFMLSGWFLWRAQVPNPLQR